MRRLLNYLIILVAVLLISTPAWAPPINRGGPIGGVGAGGAGTVNTTGTPVDNDAAVFTDADTLEGLSTAEFKALFNLETGTDVQAWDADLDTYAGITPSANIQSLLAAATYAAARGLLDLEGGTDFYSVTATDTWRNSVSQVEMGYLDGVTSDIQTQLDAGAGFDPASPGEIGGTVPGIGNFTTVITDSVADPRVRFYDINAAGAAKADEDAGSEHAGLTTTTEDAEVSDRFSTHFGCATAGTEYRHLWWDASDAKFYLGIGTDVAASAAVAGYERLVIDTNTATDNQIELLTDSGATAIIITGMTLDATVPTYESTTATITVAGASGVYYNNDNDVIEFDLPAAATGKQFCFNAFTYAQVITIDPDGTDTITLDGTTAAGGEAIVSSGAAGESVCVQGKADAIWVAFGPVGTWAEASP